MDPQTEERLRREAESFSSRLAETAETAKMKTENIAAATAAKAKEVTTTVGHKVKELADRIRERSPHESVRNTTNRVADGLESAGTYLEEKSFQGMVDDVSGVIRRYPLQSLLIGIGLGFLLSRKRGDH